jgi:Ran GTPase-activating protein (RanGAP) involved in mRNA processing and transport
MNELRAQVQALSDAANKATRTEEVVEPLQAVSRCARTAADLGVQRKEALVVGVSAYAGGARLVNTRNDAEDVAAALEAVGFRVATSLDCDRREFTDALQAFVERLAPGVMGFFYFSGHGCEKAGNTYLLLKDWRVGDGEEELQSHALPSTLVLSRMLRAEAAAAIVVLDACRDAPVTRTTKQSTSMALAAQEQTMVLQNGGSVVAYSTAPGMVSLDTSDNGRNGVYARHLLPRLRQAGVTVANLFGQVSADVNQATNGKQRPWSAQHFDKHELLQLCLVDGPLASRSSRRATPRGGGRGGGQVLPARPSAAAVPGIVTDALDSLAGDDVTALAWGILGCSEAEAAALEAGGATTGKALAALDGVRLAELGIAPRARRKELLEKIATVAREGVPRVPAASLGPDDVAALAMASGGAAELALAEGGISGTALSDLDEEALVDLGVTEKSQRDAILAFLREGARPGELRAARLRLEELRREQGALEWLHSQGLGSDLLKASYVNLEKRGLTDTHMARVALLLKVNASLNRLDLDNNTIGDAGAVALAPAFKSMASLKELYLYNNQIGDAGATELAPAFKSMASLNWLFLSNNQIGDAGAAALAPAFKTMASLEKLYLYNNQIGDSGAAALATALPSMASLKELSIGGNQIGDAGAVALAPAFKSMASLKELYLFDNKMGDSGKNAIRSAFKNANL